MQPPCFPSLVLFLVCCPPRSTVPDEELQYQCPAEYQLLRRDHPDCCGGSGVLDYTAWLRRQLPRLGLSTGGGDIFQSAAHEDRLAVIEFLERFVLDFDFRSIEAWRVLVLAGIHDAGLLVDNWKARWVAGGSRRATELLQEAKDISRRLGRVLLRAEAFHQFLIANRAVEEFLTYNAVDPEDIRSTFSGPLEWYKVVNPNRDLLTFSAIPMIEDALRGGLPEVNASAAPVALVVVSLGEFAKPGFVTIWSLLKFRSVPLRVFVMGDAAGLLDWQRAVQELSEGPGQARLAAVTFEYIDLASIPSSFASFREAFPKECAVSEMGWALLARLMCHQFLPQDVDRVIALDLGDVLVLDNVADLWAEFGRFQAQHLFAAAYVSALHHVNGGVVLYHLQRMRERDFASLALRAARDGLARSGDCIHDQSVLNTIYTHRKGPSPMMLLPCKWNMVPITEWQMQWNSPEMWLPEVAAHLRYPGLIAGDHVELYCPDAIDLLSPWSFLVITQDVNRRLRRTALDEASRRHRYCVPGTHHCCECGGKASAVHIPGDLKQWPFIASWLNFHRPPWTHEPALGLEGAETRKYWLRGQRFEIQKESMIDGASAMAEAFGGQVCFDRAGRKCCSLRTKRVPSLQADVHYHTVNLDAVKLPLRFEIECNAPADAYMLIGMGVADAVEVTMGVGGGRYSTLRWLSGGAASPLGGKQTCAQLGVDDVRQHPVRWNVVINEEGRLEIEHADRMQGNMVIWGLYLPGPLVEGMRQGPVHVYVGVPDERVANWLVCQPAKPRPRKPAPVPEGQLDSP